MPQIVESLRSIVCLFVDCPDEVRVSPVTDGKGFLLEIVVAKRDLGKVIGRMGRTAQALRQIIQAVSMTHNLPMSVNIVDAAQQRAQ